MPCQNGMLFFVTSGSSHGPLTNLASQVLDLHQLSIAEGVKGDIDDSEVDWSQLHFPARTLFPVALLPFSCELNACCLQSGVSPFPIVGLSVVTGIEV